jgi:hypothetical protein
METKTLFEPSDMEEIMDLPKELKVFLMMICGSDQNRYSIYLMALLTSSDFNGIWNDKL